ncbi:MAG: hypothetical protein ACM3S1_00965 [Hyphomicrobiales bacterium]
MLAGNMAANRRFSGLRHFDWDAVAGIVAAVAALVLHLFGVVNEEVLLAITLLIVALLLLRDLRREEQADRLETASRDLGSTLADLRNRMEPPDTRLIGPRALRQASESFSARAQGEMTWFNVCLLMFRPQELFDSLLGSAIDNPAVTSIQFILDDGERENWQQYVVPKVVERGGEAKLREPYWCELRESVSFILADMRPDGRPRAHLSFWGEPFMARTAGRDIPRYIFEVESHSELIPRLAELERSYRSAARR